jgi:3-phenylpropionate/trans-cinnamate dioxygenase ferredoxin subunit
MGEFRTVGSAGDVPDGGLRGYEVDGRRVCVARTGGGWHAFDDICTHQQCWLSDGDLQGTELECACHGSVFDITSGAVRNGPASEPIEVFEARVEGDDLQVAL